ncbi:MAG: DUF5011 domain-containing protein [bacterium]|nr:DUF5011 domain-containing protein [bacterium]
MSTDLSSHSPVFKKLTTFIKYHNALPLGFIILFLGFGGAMAANDELRGTVAGAVISKEVSVESVDNSFIVNANLQQFVPSAQIVSVTEDNENYYIAYALETIDLADSAWKIVLRSKEFSVSKALLGAEDLGVYVAEEIGEVVDRQISYLKEVQNKERKVGETQKIVSTTYSGLIGKYLDSKREVIEGYTPIEKPREQEIAVQSSIPVSENILEAQPASVAVIDSGIRVSTGSGATMVMMGNNPAKIPTDTTGGGYSDNGVRAQDNKGQSLSVSFAVNGVSMQEVSIDTRKIGVHAVRYTASDQEGNIMALERTIIVYDQYKITAPVIAILGDAIVNSKAGESYTDAGAIAIDYDDGDVTKNITIENTVNATLPGTYTVRYSVTDSNGNTTVADRFVTITE